MMLKMIRRRTLNLLCSFVQIVTYMNEIFCIISAATRTKIKNVIDQYMNKTCIRFIDVTGRTSSVRTYLSIKPSYGFVLFYRPIVVNSTKI